MCGILGFFDTAGGQGATAKTVGQAMARALASRGPDDEGLWQDLDAGLLLGHRRLAILDLSPEGHQPMVSPSGRYIIVFNGEIYNFQDLQKDLIAAGVIFRGRSDTEVMLAAFDQWGINRALQKMNGMFAFALWDRQDRTLHLVRDRLGKKPLYVGWAGSALVFASELKSLRAHPAFKPAVNRDALAQYMRNACVPAPFSIYDGVWQLLPGCRLTITSRAPQPGAALAPLMEPYWHVGRAVDEARHAAAPLTDATALSTFETLLRDCVRERMISDVPLGALLSGGLDSSAVVALMQQQSDRPVKTFTIGFQENNFDEAAAARAMATHLRTDHHELYITPADALAVIPRLPDIYDEPFADESQIPAVLVSAFARRQVTVALTGDGGDEMLGGYARHTNGAGLWSRAGWLPRPIRRGLGHGLKMIGPAHWDKLNPTHPRFGERVHKAADLLAARNTGDVYIQILSRWNDEGLVTGSHPVMTPLTNPAWQPATKLNFADRMMFADTISYLPNDILVKVDRASMACGLECRAPLLDKRIFDFAWRLPPDLKIRNGQGKFLLRELLARHAPRALFERPKQGFSVPLASWLRGPLKDWAASLLDNSKLRQQGYLNTDIVSAAWQDFTGGNDRHAYRLWTVLMFQAWLARWESGIK